MVLLRKVEEEIKKLVRYHSDVNPKEELVKEVNVVRTSGVHDTLTFKISQKEKLENGIECVLVLESI